MNLPELMAHYEQLATEAGEIHSTAPVEELYRKVIFEVEGLDGVPTRTDKLDQWLTVEEMVKITGYSRSYLYAHKAEVPFIHQNGGPVRVSQRDLTKFMASRTH